MNDTTPLPPDMFGIVPFSGNEDELPRPKYPYYLLTKEAVFVHKPTHFGFALLPLNKVDTLPALDRTAQLWKEFPPLPGTLVGQAWSFFRAIWDKKRTEAMVYITHHREHGYRFFVPTQTCTGGNVSATFEPKHIAKGWRLVGTIHSHCDFSAFHSGVDEHDASEMDGLHLTIGHVDKPAPEVAAMIAINGHMWEVKSPEYQDGDLTLTAHPAWWERYVNDPVRVVNNPPSGQGKGKGKPNTQQSNMFDEDDWGFGWRGSEGYGYNQRGWRPAAAAPNQLPDRKIPMQLPYRGGTTLRYANHEDLVDRIIRDGRVPYHMTDEDYEQLVDSEVTIVMQQLDGLQDFGIVADLTWHFQDPTPLDNSGHTPPGAKS